MDRYVDFGALAEVVLIAFGAGVGIVVLFTVGTIGLGMVRSGPNGSKPAAKILGGTIAFVGFAMIAVAVVVGLYLLLKK